MIYPVQLPPLSEIHTGHKSSARHVFLVLIATASMESRTKPENYMYNNVLHQQMMLDLELKKIGNSMGFVIPADVVNRENLSLGTVYSVAVIEDRMAGVRASFGTLKRVIDTDEAMKEVSDGGRD